MQSIFGDKLLTLKVMAATGLITLAEIEEAYAKEGYCFVCGDGNVKLIEKEVKA